MAAALALAERGLGRTGNNPSVGCIIVKGDKVVGRGWTQAGGRPHAEAMALEQAGPKAAGATVYVTLEPCAHFSERGPSCASMLVAARPARVVAALQDPDPRTAGKGFAELTAAGIAVDTGVLASDAAPVLAGFVSRIVQGRPHVTLKLATSLRRSNCDGRRQQPLDHRRGGPRPRSCRTRALRCNIGRRRNRSRRQSLARCAPCRNGGPQPAPGHVGQRRSARRLGGYPCAKADIGQLDCNTLVVEGGALAASSFLRAGLVDRLICSIARQS